jgi:predicted ATPase/DNA-binding SARP family transcriptional activator
MLEIRMLGEFSIKSGNKSIALTTRRAQSLFAYLVLNAGSSHRREKLAGQLWPDSREEAARDYLRHALWRIRKALTSVAAAHLLKADDLSVTFVATDESIVDVATVSRGATSQIADELMQALAVYQGDLLPGFYDEWVVLEREHLKAIYEREMGRLLGMLEQAGRWSDVIEWAERWIAFGQKPELAYRGLLLAHAAKGDMSQVAMSYERCVKTLAEFGMEPSELTRVLFEEIKAGKHTSTPKLPAPPAKEASSSSNIPVPLTSFVGREGELKKISELLTASRLVTLTGPGGVGKTRLAIRAAGDASSKYRDGVCWVGLVALTDPGLVAQEVAQALRVREAPPEPLLGTLIGHLRSRQMLLVLDNCEHLIEACARLSEQLLEACPDLRILTTGIEGLGLFNEAVWQVPSLPLPESGAQIPLKDVRSTESVRLFEDRAANASPAFQVDENTAADVTQICRRLDGIPLAIELAAARMKVLSVQEIAARLDDRFSLLTSGSRTAIPRHQTLRATIDWSHELLAEPERILFRRLSVFAGGFTLTAAEAVCGQSLPAGDILDLLSRLVGKSLVVVDAPGDGETRYRLLETIRQYALEKLVDAGEAPETRQRHLDFFLRLAEESESHVYGRESGIWFRRLYLELDNLRAAIEWATASGRAQFTLRILGSIVYFWFARGLPGSEWTDRVNQALRRPESRERTLARAKALNGIGFMYWADVDTTDRRAELEEALAIGTELGDPRTTATALRHLGLLENLQGRHREARRSYEKSLEIWQSLDAGGKLGWAHTLAYFGDLALMDGNAGEARSIFEKAAETLRDSGDLNFLAYSIRRLGHLELREGHHAKAAALCRRSLELNLEVDDPRGVCACLAAFVAIAMAQGESRKGALLAAAVDEQLVQWSIPLLFVDRLEFEQNLARLRSELPAKTLQKAWAEGGRLTMEKAIGLALEIAVSEAGPTAADTGTTTFRKTRQTHA